MPEMRAETIREAQRKGLSATEDVSDPYDLTTMSRPTGTRPDGPASDGATSEKPHAVTARAERLRTGRHLHKGEAGGPS